MEYHEAANIFPLDEKDIPGLAKDIKKNGLLCPIELLDGKVIDGRRRLLACDKAGIEPEFCDVKVPDPIAYVLSLNYHRRHLDKSQMAMAAARAKELREKFKTEAKERKRAGQKEGGRVHTNTASGPPGPQAKPSARRSRDDIGKAFGVSGRSVERARAIIDEGVPNVVESVDKGKLSVRKAADIVRLPEKAQPEALRDALKPRTKKKKDLPKEKKIDGSLPGKGIILANEAINALSRIPKNDPTRKRGFQIVSDWMRHNS